MISDTLFFKGVGPFEKTEMGGRNRLLRGTPGNTDNSECPPERTPGTKGLNPSQTLHTHLRPFTPISGPPHSSKALHTNLRSFTLISGPPHPLKALHTYLRYSMPILGSLTLFYDLVHPT